jgi:hypothetical protein
MNDLNSVLLEGKGRALDRGKSIVVTVNRHRTGPDGVVTEKIDVPVVPISGSAVEAMLQMRDGQGVRLSGRLVDGIHFGFDGLMVATEYIELRKIKQAVQEELEDA